VAAWRSLIGGRFVDGRIVTDNATEVRHGVVRNGVAELESLVTDTQGNVHEDLLVRGDNPVLLTFDLALEMLD
jgi:hypothetical protein